MRLNAYLARAGVASRRGADELIKAGRVRVNGAAGRAEHLRRRGDTVEVDGRPVGKQRARPPAPAQAGRRRHDRARPARAADRRRARPRRAARRPGRPPRRRHDRRAPADERRPARAPARPPALRGRQGLRGRGRGRPGRGRAAPARARASSSTTAARRRRSARRLGRGRIELTIHEGRKHQVKRMLEAVGHPVRRLHRSRYAGLDLRGLAPGEWRELTQRRGRPRCAQLVGATRRT